MATASSMAGVGVKNAWENVAASSTDEVLVAAAGTGKIRVLEFLINHGSTTASTVTFNSKGSGAGTAISPAFLYAANGGTSISGSKGWFETNRGEALTVTTGTGSTTGIIVVYQILP